MLVTLKEILEIAEKKKIAIGSFNASGLEAIEAELAAAEELQLPIIIQFAQCHEPWVPLDTIGPIMVHMAKRASIPVCVHLDHGETLEYLAKALEIGFTGIMYDGSVLSYEENLANTAKVCEVAHACGASVEAELGSIAAGEKSHEGSASDIEAYTDPELAGKFVKETGVDALAVSVGTVHGLYKGKPNIRTDILEKIDQNTQIPLVLHGGSGVPEQDILNCIERGIAKINVNTEISAYTVESTAEYLKKEQPHFSVLSLKQEEYVKEIVKKYIAFFGR